MKSLVRFMRVVAATMLACGLLYAGSAAAARIAQPQVTGHVTAVSRDNLIAVDGHQYLVASGSGAAKVAPTLHVGDVVGLYFDGSPGTAASRVIMIQVSASGP